MENELHIESMDEIMEKCDPIFEIIKRSPLTKENGPRILIIGKYPDFQQDTIFFTEREFDSEKRAIELKEPSDEKTTHLLRLIESAPRLKKIIISNVLMNEEFFYFLREAILGNCMIKDIEINNLTFRVTKQVTGKVNKYENVEFCGDIARLNSFSLGIL